MATATVKDKEKRLKELEEKIKANKVKKGQTFKDFASLCDYIGVDKVKSSGQREALKKQFSRFFDFESPDPKSRRIVITKTHYKIPKAIPSKRTGKHVTDIVKSIIQMILMCDEMFTSDHTVTDTFKVLGLNRQAPKSIKGCWKTIYLDWEQRTRGHIKSAFNQIGKNGFAEVTKYYDARSEIITETKYQEYRAKVEIPVLKKHGYKTIGQARYAGKLFEILDELNVESLRVMKFKMPCTKYHLERIPGIEAELIAVEILRGIGADDKTINVFKTAGVLTEMGMKFASEAYWDEMDEYIKEKVEEKFPGEGFGDENRKLIFEDYENIKNSEP